MSRMNKINQKLEKSGIILPDNEPLKLGGLTKIKECLWVALTTFFIVYGLSGIFLTGFSMPYKSVSLVFYIMLSAMAFSLIRFNLITYFVGYAGCIGYIVYYTVKNYEDFTNGINAIMNICIETCDNIFTLPFVRTYMETNTDREETVTTAMIMICMVAACVVSLLLVYKYSVGFIIFISLIVIEFSIYLTDYYEPKYFVVLFLGIALYIFTLQNNKLPLPLTSKLKSYSFKRKLIVSRKRVVSKKNNLICSFALAVAIYLVFLIVAFFVPAKFTAKNSTLKDKTDDIVYTVAYKGIEALFKREIESASDNNNGSTPGAFGNVAQMKYTGTTELQIAFVPYSTDSIYLQTFCASTYDGENRQWTNALTHIIEIDKFNNSLSSLGRNYNTDYQSILDYMFNHPNSYETDKDEKIAEASMYIKNVADEGANYVLPYYADSEALGTIYNREGGTYGSLNVEDSTVISYHPWFDNIDEIKNCDFGDSTEDSIYINNSSEYNEDIYSDVSSYISSQYTSVANYAYSSEFLAVPDNIQSTLEQICEDEGFSGTTEDIVEQIQDYFEDNFTYTLSPGVTPVGEDYVEYFLTQQKQGLCVHFASSACLLLRTLGIPARYCEGYRIDSDEFYNKKLQISADDLTTYFGTNATTDSLYDGYTASKLGDLPVLVNVTDEDAHAWVEVYYDGVGWVPVEFTVAQTASSRFSVVNSNGKVDIGNFPGAKIINAIINFIISIINNIWTIVIILIICIILYKRFTLRYRLFYAPAKQRVNNQYNYIVLMLKQDLKRKFYDTHKKNKYPINPGEIVLSRKKLQVILIGTYKCKRSTIRKLLDYYEFYNYGPADEFYNGFRMTKNFSAFTEWFSTKVPRHMRLYYKFMLKKPKKDLPGWIIKLIEKSRKAVAQIKYRFG